MDFPEKVEMFSFALRLKLIVKFVDFFIKCNMLSSSLHYKDNNKNMTIFDT